MFRSGMSQGSALGGEGRMARESALRQRTLPIPPPQPRDRISELQDHIAHHIMSFLPTKDAVRTVSWSKRWQSIWWNYPIHDFDESRYRQPDVSTNRADLIGAMIDGCHRDNGQNPVVQKLRIHAIYPNDVFLQTYATNYIEFGITESKLLDLDITFDSMYCYAHSEAYPSAFLFPNLAFTSGTYLTSLKLQACDCGPCENFSLPSLEKISLKYVSIDDKTLELLISSSPVLKEVEIEYCFDINVLRILNPSLGTLSVANSEDLSLLEMDVPELRFFRYSGAYIEVNNPAVAIEEQFSEILEFKSPNGTNGFKKLNTALISNLKMSDETAAKMFSSFKNLETVTLMYCTFTTVPLKANAKLESVSIDCCDFLGLQVSNQSLHSFSISSNTLISNLILTEVSGNTFVGLRTVSLGGNIHFLNGCFDFETGPFLETLILRSCPGLKDIKLSSNTLKTLVIELCLQLETASIVAKNLEEFKHTGFLFNISMMIISTEVTVDLSLMKPNRMYLSTALYGHNLWSFLQHFQFAKALRIQSDHALSIIVPMGLRYPPAFRFLNELHVKTILRGRIINYLRYLLEVLSLSFCFETVTLNTVTSDIQLKFFVPANTAYKMKHILNIDNLGHKHDCVAQHLLKVKFGNFQGNTNEMEVIAYLLRTATLLNSVAIYFKRGFPSPAAVAVAQLIKGFPVASRVLLNFMFFLPTNDAN